MRSCLTILFIAAAAVPIAPTLHDARAAEPAALELEMKIPLGDVRGRIDHLAFDSKRRRLLIAELGNGTVASVDLAGRKVVHVLSGLKEPQGVAYLPSDDTLYIANGGDGSVRVLKASDYSDNGRVDLGDDADNVRIDSAANRVFVGYGGGAMAIIDPTARSKIADIPLRAHPRKLPARARVQYRLRQSAADARDRSGRSRRREADRRLAHDRRRQLSHGNRR
jgi:DNA-binding beta-propeller fold protein YncE